ncbi:MAG: hypothetical protein AABW51_02395 [Nanoarchaeota archaeon]
MPTVTFKLDKDRDIRNVWELCNMTLPWTESTEKKPLERDYQDLFRNRSFEECREEIWNSIKGLYSLGIVDAFTASAKKSWEGLNQEYFLRLERVTGRAVYTQNFVAYTTTVGRCPYNIQDNSFMLSIRRPLLQCLRTSGHELMHLQFSHYFLDKMVAQIGNAKTADLNESLTVLLNLEFEDLWLVEDRGYPSHEKLREFIALEWKKEKDFDVLLEKCVGYLKG